jgi:hypothetical protein
MRKEHAALLPAAELLLPQHHCPRTLLGLICSTVDPVAAEQLMTQLQHAASPVMMSFPLPLAQQLMTRLLQHAASPVRVLSAIRNGYQHCLT